MMISKIKNGWSAKPAAWRGPKPVKIAIFEVIKKNEKSKKSYKGTFIMIFLTPGGTLGGGFPP